jgi:hypothetical protein
VSSRRTGSLLVVSFVACLAASSAFPRADQDVPIGQLRGLAQSYAPGARLPTKLPPGVTAVDVGIASGVNRTMPRPLYHLTFHSPTKSAFQYDFWAGHVKGGIVAALLKHDGTRGSKTTFRAGKYSGTLEIQKNDLAKLWIASYVWEYGAHTYMLAVQERVGGTPLYPRFSPQATIASLA